MATLTLQTPKSALNYIDEITTVIGQENEWKRQIFQRGQAANAIKKSQTVGDFLRQTLTSEAARTAANRAVASDSAAPIYQRGVPPQGSAVLSPRSFQVSAPVSGQPIPRSPSFGISGVTQPVNRLPVGAVPVRQSTGLIGRAVQGLGRVGQTLAPLGNVLGKINTAATLAQAGYTGFQIGTAARELYEAQLGIDVSRSALEFATQELRFQEAQRRQQQEMGQGSGTSTPPLQQQAIGQPPLEFEQTSNTSTQFPQWRDPLGLGEFTQTSLWTPQQPQKQPQSGLIPPISQNFDISQISLENPLLDAPEGRDFGITTPIQQEAPEIEVDRPVEPDLQQGFGGVSLNWPIYQLLREVADGIQQPNIDFSEITSRLDAIASSLPPIMQALSGISTSLQTIPENTWDLMKNPLAEMLKVTGETTFQTTIEELTETLKFTSTEITTQTATVTSSAIGSALYPLLTGIYATQNLVTAVANQIDRQKLETLISLPQTQTMGAVLPQVQTLAAVLPQTQTMGAVLPQAQTMGAVLPQAQTMSAAIPTAVQLDFSVLNAQILSLNISLQTALQTQLKLQEDLNTLNSAQTKCCGTIDRLKNEQDKINQKIKFEIERNKERFKQEQHEIELRCDADNPEKLPIKYSGSGITMPGTQAQFKTIAAILKEIYKRVCRVELDDLIEGAFPLSCPQDEEGKTEILFTGQGLGGISAQIVALSEMIRRYSCPPELQGSVNLECLPPYAENDSRPVAADWNGRGLLAISNQIEALTKLNYEILRNACNIEADPIFIDGGHETHLDEFPITKTLQLSFGEYYPTQNGSLWHLKIPYPKGEFIESSTGELSISKYSLWSWEDFEIDREHGNVYCRLNLANSSRFLAMFAPSEEYGTEFLRTIYAKFVDSTIAPPSQIAKDGLPLVRVSPRTKPKRNPRNGETRCVRAVITEWDDNNRPIKCYPWKPKK